MKLSEFNLLDEIQKIPAIDNHLADLSKVQNIEIIKNKYLDDFYIEKGQVGDQIVFFVRSNLGNRADGHKLIAFIVGQEISDLQLDSNRKPVMIVRTWCEPKFRNNGIITNLYRYLYTELRFALISDILQTPETVSIWNKVRNYWPVKMIDINTGKIEDIDDVRLYSKNEKLALIVEHIDILKTSPFFKATLANNGILEDYRFNINGL